MKGVHTILVFLMSCSILLAKAQMASPLHLHKIQYDEKRQLLQEVWQKNVNWFPGQAFHRNYDEIQLDLPDSCFHKGPGFLDTLMYFYVQVYYHLTAENTTKGTDSILGAFFNQADTSKPAYTTIYSINSVKKSAKPYLLYYALAYFTPFLKYTFVNANEIVICLRLNESITEEIVPLAGNYADKLTSLIAKYFLSYDVTFQRILVMWDDKNENCLHTLYYPNSKRFEKATRFL